uniref:Uncharacterized protein n=1 Tax=Leviviridae sp. TaxID=2027243 RepID=A0A514D8Q7_9VIRU|nr:MAG: hypothetical protein H1Bulk29184_000003 [Leviviridae sp.]
MSRPATTGKTWFAFGMFMSGFASGLFCLLQDSPICTSITKTYQATL